MISKDQARQLRDRARRDPVWWVEETLGAKLWSKQREVIESVRDNSKTAVRSCNGAGKSFHCRPGHPLVPVLVH